MDFIKLFKNGILSKNLEYINLKFILSFCSLSLINEFNLEFKDRIIPPYFDMRFRYLYKLLNHIYFKDNKIFNDDKLYINDYNNDIYITCHTKTDNTWRNSMFKPIFYNLESNLNIMNYDIIGIIGARERTYKTNFKINKNDIVVDIGACVGAFTWSFTLC